MLACGAAVVVLACAAPVVALACAAPVGVVLACAAAVGVVLACAVPVSGAPFSPVPLNTVTTATAAHKKAAAALADRRAGITGRPALRIPAPRSVTLSS